MTISHVRTVQSPPQDANSGFRGWHATLHMALPKWEVVTGPPRASDPSTADSSYISFPPVPTSSLVPSLDKQTDRIVGCMPSSDKSKLAPGLSV